MMLRHPRPGVTFFVQCGCDVVLVRFKAGLRAAPSTLRALFVEGAVSRGGPSTLRPGIEEGSAHGVGPSTLRPGIEEGPAHGVGPSMLRRHIEEGSMPQRGTIHAKAPNRGRCQLYYSIEPSNFPLKIFSEN